MNSNQVELYTTSLGIVRSTYLRCLLVERILHNHLITYDVKDVSLNQIYLKELKEKLGKDVTELPQVFLEGKHLGNAERIEYLNETGELRCLLQEIQKVEWGDKVKKCVSHWNRIIEKHKEEMELSRSKSFCSHISSGRKNPVYIDAETNTILSHFKIKQNLRSCTRKYVTRPVSADAATNTILSLRTKSLKSAAAYSSLFPNKETETVSRKSEKSEEKHFPICLNVSIAENHVDSEVYEKNEIITEVSSGKKEKYHVLMSSMCNINEVSSFHKGDEKKSYIRQIFSVVSRKKVKGKINPDIEIIINGQVRQCHRFILERHSSLFANEKHITKQTKQFYLQLKGITIEAFDLIYEWMLNSTDVESFNKLRKFNFLPIYITSDVLQITTLQQELTKILNHNDIFWEEDAFFLFQQAIKYGRKDVIDQMLSRIKNFFLVLVSSNDFLHLSIKEVMLILSSNFIVINSETEVFFAAVYWLMFDWENRKQFLLRVMDCVRFVNMQIEELTEIPFDKTMTKIYQNITEDQEIKKKINYALNYRRERDLTKHGKEVSKDCPGGVCPLSRNWSGLSKIYKSFTDFLKFIKKIRECPTIVYSRI